MGTVLDNATRQPLEGVWVALADTRFSAVTNHEGRFSFLNVPPGRHVVESNQLGYAFRADSLTFLKHTLGLRIALSEEAIALDPITVTGTRDRNALRDAEIARIQNPFSARFQGITPSEMDEIRPRVNSVFDVIRRANIPGIRITPIAARGFGEARDYCVEHVRGINRTARCDSVAVFIDDIPVLDAATALDDIIPSNDISHIQFMPAFDAMARYGKVAENGALLIYTRRD